MSNAALSPRRWLRIAHKELKESLRDRRTLVTLLAMPLLLYPLLSLILQRLALAAAPPATNSYRIGVDTPEEGEKLIALIAAGRAALEAGEPNFRVDRGSDFLPQPSQGVAPPMIDIFLAADPRAELLQGNFDLLVAVESGSGIEESDGSAPNRSDDETPADPIPRMMQIQPRRAESDPAVNPQQVFPAELEVQFREDDPVSEAALSRLIRLLSAVNEQAAAAMRRATPFEDPPPVLLRATAATQDDSRSSMILAVIPLILVLMTVTGAVYPAIDLTAGERERGTLEALLATPISPVVLLSTKYLAVLMVAILTAGVNLLAMTVTLRLSGIGSELLGGSSVGWQEALRLLPLLVMFAAFYSSVLLALCSFARSFKEAQAYLIPVMLLSLGPGLVSLMPGVRLTTVLAVVPLINMILLTRDSLQGGVPLPLAAMVLVTTAGYTAMGLMLAAQAFVAQRSGSEDDLPISQLVGRPEREDSMPTVGELTTYLTAFFPIYFLTTNLLARRVSGDVASQAVLNAAVTLVLFALLPAAFAVYRRINIPRTFRLRPGGGAAIWAAVLLLAGSLWIIAFEILILSKEAGISTLSEEQSAAFKELQERFIRAPWWLTITTMAVVPAICEEFFFRGFVLSALLRRRRPAAAVGWTAVMFAVFHVVSGSVLSVERFLPSLLLGAYLSWIAWRSGSLWPSIALHALHNALLFTLPYREDWLRRLGLEGEVDHLPLAWIATALVVAAAATGLLWLTCRGPSSVAVRRSVSKLPLS